MNWINFKRSLTSTVSTTGMLFIIVLGAMILGYFFSVTRLPVEFATYVSSLPVNRYVILLFIILVYSVLGCLMDSLAIVLLTVPVFFRSFSNSSSIPSGLESSSLKSLKWV